MTVLRAPFWESHNGETAVTLYQGDVLEVLREMPDESVHCVVTSPPYYGLRDYGTATWEGEDADCDHRSPTMREGRNEDRAKLAGSAATNSAQLLLAARSLCGKCGARRIDAQIGLEPTPEAYVSKMVEVFREVRRVLRRDGTCWLNCGDSYASASACDRRNIIGQGSPTPDMKRPNRLTGDLKEKDLMGMPWMLAFALRSDGWWLRSDIVWSKPNPMPESVTDRPTKSHEYIFLMTKAATYFYDADAVREPHAYDWTANAAAMNKQNRERRARVDLSDGAILGIGGRDSQYANGPNPAGRNRRTVWEIATQPYPEAHFATFPQKLVEPCLLAGTSEKGCCSVCGAPWERVTETERSPRDYDSPVRRGVENGWRTASGGNVGMRPDHVSVSRTTGWKPTCDHDAPPVPATVLDPFAGSGTTMLVSQRLGRSSIGIDLNAQYLQLAKKRIGAEHGQMRLGVRG